MNNRLNKYKYPGAKRLMLEALELKDNTEDYCAQPLDDNLFEWHFTVRGPPDTAFDGGYYHGRLSFPTEYPMKPPSIILLTPNGRFKTNKKICLSISGYHPETWQPSWSVRTALLALIAFMPTPANRAIGSLDFSDAERRKLAISSRTWSCETCGLIKDLLVPPGNNPGYGSSPEASDDGSSRVNEGSSGNSCKHQCATDSKCCSTNEKCDDSNKIRGVDSNKEDASGSCCGSSSGGSSGGSSGSEGETGGGMQVESTKLKSDCDKSETIAKQPTKDGTTSPSEDQLNTNSNSSVTSTPMNHNRNGVRNLNERRQTYPPLLWKSIFVLLSLLILRRVVMVIQL